MKLKNVAAIILAAGKGTRIKAKKINKVMFPLNKKPMVAYAAEKLKKIDVGQIILVIGFAKESIINYFNSGVKYAVQKKRMGTGHAARIGLSKVKKSIKYTLVFYGDDSAFYPKRLFEKLIKICQKERLVLTFLTLKKKNPFGLGRVVRDNKGKVIKIVEEKNATERERKIKEINLGCYCFEREFLEKFIGEIKKDRLTREYYLPDMIKIALDAGLPIKAIMIENENYWHGVNTQEEFLKAQEKIKKINGKK